MAEIVIPRHVAIILDGNGRWAKKRFIPRNAGHVKGAGNVEPVCRAAKDMGIKYVTMYVFSTENWKRPKEEVDALMDLLYKYLSDSEGLCKRNNMRMSFIGDRSALTPELRELMRHTEEFSKDFTDFNLILAINYGSRDEITRGFKRIILDPSFENCNREELAEKVTEACIADHLDTAGIPDPDLCIRTSGEQRLSNYLLWQLAYAEFFFTPVLWPDFGKKELTEAVEYYSTRDRRFGGIKESK
jgi:undecaprenyl diphosphate synthase